MTEKQLMSALRQIERKDWTNFWIYQGADEEGYTVAPSSEYWLDESGLLVLDLMRGSINRKVFVPVQSIQAIAVRYKDEQHV